MNIFRKAINKAHHSDSADPIKARKLRKQTSIISAQT